MNEYIPTTEEICAAFRVANHLGAGIDTPEAEARFNRWLADHDREVSARAWDEGYTMRGSDEWCRVFRQNFIRTKNPYREGVD